MPVKFIKYIPTQFKPNCHVVFRVSLPDKLMREDTRCNLPQPEEPNVDQRMKWVLVHQLRTSFRSDHVPDHCC